MSMNREAALAEARRRWGPHAGAFGEQMSPFGEMSGNYCAERDREYPRYVTCGHFSGTDVWDEGCKEHEGWGETFEEAFADADKRAGKGANTDGK